MSIQCPSCGATIALDDVNVARDIALCRSCGQTCSFADNVDSEMPKVEPEEPPRGAWYEETFDGFRVGSTTRHPMGCFLVPFMTVWSGGSLGGIYGTQLIQGKFDLFQSLFGIPFLLGTIFLGGLTIMSVAGRMVVSVSGDEGHVFQGVGPIGWRRRFSWVGARSVVQETKTSSDSGPTRSIRIQGDDSFAFGSMLNETRRRYVIGVLRSELQRRGPQPAKARFEAQDEF